MLRDLPTDDLLLLQESNSEKNRINCSERAANILQTQWPQVVLEDRGQIEIKGKGQMYCYYVRGNR